MVTNLAMADATAKLLIKKGVFTEEEFAAQLGAERANYLAVLKRCTDRIVAERTAHSAEGVLWLL